MLDLEKRGKDIRCFVHALEGWMIDALADLGVAAHRAEGRIGIWVGEGADEAKIGALGVRVKRWVTLHGFSLNVAPDLSHFGGIVPCGIAEFGVTSLAELGKQMPLTRVDAALKAQFSVISQRFGTAVQRVLMERPASDYCPRDLRDGKPLSDRNK